MRLSGIIFISILSIFCFCCNAEDNLEPLTYLQLKALNYIHGQSEFILYIDSNHLPETDFLGDYHNTFLNINDSQKWLMEFESATDTRLKDGARELYLFTSLPSENIFIIRFDKNYEKTTTEIYFPRPFLMVAANSRELIKSITSNEFKSIKKDSELYTAIDIIKKKKYYLIVTINVSDYAAAIAAQFFNSIDNGEIKKIFT